MRIIYAKTGGECREYDYDPDDLLASEAEAVERATRMPYDYVDLELMMGSAVARRAVLWVLMKRENPRLKLADVDFRKREVTVEFDRADRDRVRKMIRGRRDISEDEKNAVFDQLDAEDAADGEQDQEPDPKPQVRELPSIARTPSPSATSGGSTPATSTG